MSLMQQIKMLKDMLATSFDLPAGAVDECEVRRAKSRKVNAPSSVQQSEIL